MLDERQTSDSQPCSPAAPEEPAGIAEVLQALSEPMRLAIVRTLADGVERPCGTVDVPVSKPTLSHHLRVLHQAGVVNKRLAGTRKYVSLRRDDLERRYPGLLESVLRGAERDGLAPAPSLAVN